MVDQRKKRRKEFWEECGTGHESREGMRYVKHYDSAIRAAKEIHRKSGNDVFILHAEEVIRLNTGRTYKED